MKEKKNLVNESIKPKKRNEVKVMRPYKGTTKIAATGPCNSNWGGCWCIMDSIKYGVDDSILVTYQDSDGRLYNAHWCRIHTDFKSGRSYINIHRCRYYIDDFLRVDM